MHVQSRQNPDVPWPVRRQRLQKLQQLLKDHQTAIIRAIESDFGRRPAAETVMLEYYPALAGIRQMLEHGKRWMRPKTVRTGLWFWPAKSRIHYQPLGTAGIIVPWNYPLYLAIEPLAAALCAGCRVMLKLSGETPAFEHWLADTLPQYFAADGYRPPKCVS